MRNTRTTGFGRNPFPYWAFTLVTLITGLSTGTAAVLPPEKLLPDDTLVMVTVPDFARARDIYRQSPQNQFWRDPAMKAFTDKFLTKWKEDVVIPLERELNMKLADFAELPQGQLTVAVTQNGWEGKEGTSPAWVLLLDSRAKSSQLKTNLAELKKKWIDADKPIRAEKIRDIEFSVVSVSSADIPKALKNALSPPPQFPDGTVAPEPEAEKPAPKKELYVGQAESLLILGDSPKVIERLLVRMSGGLAPSLSEVAAYEVNHNAMFRDAPLFGWINAKAFINILSRAPAEEGEAPSPETELRLRPDRVIAASGLNGLKTVAFSANESNEGTFFQIFLSAPEASREGLLKILAGEAKEASPPPFVPVDTVKFQRWRLDGQKAWAALEKMFREISPQVYGVINFLIETASTAAKQKDPDFDLRKSLVGNLGDDLITYQKAPRSAKPADLDSPPSLLLIGSPQPDQLVNAFKTLLAAISQPAGAVSEREFLGRKIYSVTLPPLPMPQNTKPKARSLNFAAGGGYLAISSEPAMVEEFLRSSETQGKPLRETPGLPEATQKVLGAGTSLFGFENQSETMRLTFEAMKNESGSAGNLKDLTPFPGRFALPKDDKNFKEWVDVSLLPGFDTIAKYFHFSVYGLSATVDGLSLKFFSPVPPELKK